MIKNGAEIQDPATGKVVKSRTQWTHECTGTLNGCETCTLILQIEPLWDKQTRQLISA